MGTWSWRGEMEGMLLMHDTALPECNKSVETWVHVTVESEWWVGSGRRGWVCTDEWGWRGKEREGEEGWDCRDEWGGEGRKGRVRKGRGGWQQGRLEREIETANGHHLFLHFIFALKERPDFLSMIEWSRFPLDPDNYEHAQTERKKKDLCRHTYIYLKCKW